MELRAIQTVTATGETRSPLIDVLEETFPRAMSRPAQHPKRSFLYQQGGAIVGVYCVLSGSVAMERLDEGGRMAMFGIMGPGSLIGWQDMMAGGIHRNAAETLSVCRVVMIPRPEFVTALHADMRLVELLMRQGATQLNAYEDHMLRLSTLDLSKRIYATLCSFADDRAPRQGTTEVSLPLLKRDLAALLGTSPESLSRSLRRLEEMDVAEFKAKNVVRLRMGWDGTSGERDPS